MPTMSEPTMTCGLCGKVEIVVMTRGFPPERARKKLAKRCKEDGCKSDPQYLTGLG